jgi:hypothetical protein
VLALVVVAAVLLVAGYGPAVGVGLIVGLFLGAGVGLVGVLWLHGGPGRSITLGSSYLVGTSGTGGPPDVPDWVHDGARVQAVDASPLRRVLVVRQQATASGVTIEVLTLELRGLGGVLAATASAEPPTGPPGPFARASVTDDVGGTYAAAATPGGGGPFMRRLEVRFAPAPPPTARRLELRIEEFVDPFRNHQRGAVTGPWVFTISLADQA